VGLVWYMRIILSFCLLLILCIGFKVSGGSPIGINLLGLGLGGYKSEYYWSRYRYALIGIRAGLTLFVLSLIFWGKRGRLGKNGILIVAGY